MERKWKFSITPQHGEMWDLYEDYVLEAYARRTTDGGWFVRIKTVNPSPDTEPIYIYVDGSPVDFINTLIGLYKRETP